jgi:hypothetical protein
MALIVATLLLFGALPFVLWPLIKTPPDEIVTSRLAGGGAKGAGVGRRPGGGVD